MEHASPIKAATKMLKAAGAALELARDCLVEANRPTDAGEAVGIATQVETLTRKVQRAA